MISLISTPSGLVISLRGRQYYTFSVGNMYCLLCKSEFMPGLIMYSFQPFTRAAIRHPHLACVSSLPLTARLASGISLVIDLSARFQLWILLLWSCRGFHHPSGRSTPMPIDRRRILKLRFSHFPFSPGTAGLHSFRHAPFHSPKR